MAFILASASPRRLDLLKQIARPPDAVVPADIEESPMPGELPGVCALRLAVEKASEVARSHPEDVVLGADTVVACGRRILPKPETASEARQCLQLLSGRRHRVYGGVAVFGPGHKARRLVTTHVTFKRLSRHEIESYLSTEEWRGKAGAYGIQGRAGAFVKQISGSYTNIVGLCVYTTENMLQAVLGPASS